MGLSLKGDREIYEKLLSRVAGLVRGYLTNTASRRTLDSGHVEDLVQEVLLAIHRKKHLYSTDKPILPWLFAIAKYKLIDHLRAEKRRPCLQLDETIDPAAPSSESLSEDQAFELEELLVSLSPLQKDILLMAKVERIPLAQIAEKFHMSLSAVKVTVHRTLKKVRKNQPISEL
jgi:RNA polymerase sigma-70 factor (ECF subfamily)